MPKWYRLNSSGSWTQLQSIYRLNSSGIWTKLKTIYRLNSSGSWGIVHSSAAVPAATTSPTLLNQSSSADNFYGGDTLTLKRGAYTNTTADSNTTYRMRIYLGADITKPLSDTNYWTPVVSTTYTGSNSNANTTVTYSLTDADAYSDFYVVGEVRVNNDANTAGSATYDFETTKVLSRISFTVSGLTSSGVTSDDATLDWTVGGINNDIYIYSQRLVIRETGPSGTIIQDVNPSYTARTYSFTNAFQASTLYYAVIEVIADDGWKLTANPTKLTDVHYFTTQSLPPVNTVAPTIGPLNNRGYLPVSTTLTATQGTWSNVSGTTTYAYDWYLEDSVSGSLTNTGYGGNTKTYLLTDVSDYVFVKVKATNTDGGFGTANSTGYTLDQAVVVGTISPTSVTPNVSTNFTFAISHYPTSYTINWGDSTSDYSSGSITANTATVNASVAHTYTTPGSYTITVTAQPGNKTNTASITVAQPPPGVVRNLTRVAAALSGVATDKRFTWDAPNTGGPVSKYQYKINSGSWTDVPGAGSLTYVDLFNFNTGISNTVSIRAVGVGGNGTETNSGPFTLPVITVGPTASSITTSQATISWSSTGQSSYSLAIPGAPSTPYTGTTGTSRVPTGLTADTSYTATLTITSSTSDTHTKATTFSTLGNYTVTWNATANGGTGGGTTTQTAGAAHTAPSASRNSFTVSFSANGGTGSASSTSITGTSPFIRWADTQGLSNGTGDFTYSATDGGTFTPPYSITMYARWNQGTSNAITLATVGTLAKTGHSFGGWNTATDGSGTNYNAGSSFTPTATVTLYAKWTPDTYTISYNKNTTDTVTNMPTDQTKTYGVNLTLSSNTPSRSGYTFNGWNTAANGTGTSYSAGGSYTTNAAATLYAQWSQVQYTITWNANGGSVTPGTSTGTTGTNITAPTPTRTGYTFRFWRNPLSGGDPVFLNAGATYTIGNGNFTWYAIWAINDIPNVPTGISLTRNQSTWNGTSWTWACSWSAPVPSETYGIVTYYEAYRQVGTGTVGNATLSTIQNTSTPQTNITTTSTTFSTTVQAAPRADAYVRACNAYGCSAYASGNVG